MRAALLALLVLAGAAAAHGGTTEEVRQVGPYRVTFFGYSFTTVAEQLRPSWKVEDATGQGVPMHDLTLNVTVRDVRNRTIAAYDQPLSQSTPGFVYADLLTGPRGTMQFRLPLPDGLTATFDQAVCDVDEQGQLACGPERAPTPGPAAGLLLAGLAAAAWAGRARRR